MPTLIGIFLITLPLIVVAGNDDMASLPQTIWLQVAVPLLLTIWLVGGKASPLLPVARAFVPFLALLLWAAVSTLWAVDTFASERVLFRWVAGVGLAFLIANTTESAADARKVLMALFWACVAVSAVGLLQHLGGWRGIPQAFPPAGTMGNKNVAAGFIATMVPLGVATFVTTRAAAPAFAISLAMALAFVLHTGCRAAILALLAQLVVALWLIPMRRLTPRWSPPKRGALCTGAIVFLWLATMAPSASSSIQGEPGELLIGTARPVLRFLTGAPAPVDWAARGELPPDERADRSVSIRLAVWRNSLEMIRSAPIAGVGLGNFSVHYPQFAGGGGADGTRIDERVDSAHNDYVQFIAELGLVGAGLLGWIMLLTARAVALAVREVPVEDRGLYLASALGLLGLGVLAAVSPTVNQPFALVAAATFVGITLRAGSPNRRLNAAETGPTEKEPIYRSILLIGASATLVVASAWGFNQIRADRHVLTMAYAEAREDWPAVVREGLIARRLSRARTDPRFGTASAMLRLGQAREAADMLEELVKADPYNANALGNLGIAYTALGDLQRAGTYFERVLRLRPDDRFAGAALKRTPPPTAARNSES